MLTTDTLEPKTFSLDHRKYSRSIQILRLFLVPRIRENPYKHDPFANYFVTMLACLTQIIVVILSDQKYERLMD